MYRDARAIVGQGGRSLEKGTCTDYDITMTSEFAGEKFLVLIEHVSNPNSFFITKFKMDTFSYKLVVKIRPPKVK